MTARRPLPVPDAPVRRLDVIGMFCPLPILLAAREMQRMAAGERLEVVGDDPAILEDMPVWCERAGHRLIEMVQRDGRVISLVEKGAAGGGKRGEEGKMARGAGRAERAAKARGPAGEVGGAGSTSGVGETGAVVRAKR
jgi:tRNA 2-thiouridine synthesizing protein A